MNALVIDDDPIVVTILTAMLSSKDYTVSSVSSELTVSQLEKPDFQLVLIDLQLGESSGFTIYQKYLSSTIDLKNVIFMSANSSRDARELYHLPAEAKFLEKPFKAPELFNLI